MAKRTLKGKIVSNRMKNTVIVEIERVKEHPKYRKRLTFHKRYQAASGPASPASSSQGWPTGGKEDLKIGDKVLIKECRPISKNKKWQVVKKTA